MMSRKLFNKIAAAVLLLFYSITNNAQIINTNSQLCNYSQLRLSLASVVYENLKVEHLGKKHLGSIPLPSFDACVSWHQKIGNELGVNIGVGLSIVPHNAHFNFNAQLTHPLINNTQHRMFHIDYVLYIGYLPISLQKIVAINRLNKKPYLLSFESGIKLNYVLDNPYYFITYPYIAGNITEDFFRFQLYNDKVFLTTFFIKFGVLQLSKKQNTFQYNLIANYSPKNIGKGSYEFFYLSYESYGNIRQTINYIGFEFIYGFSMKKY